MGAPMARNLLRAGHRLTVYNRTREKAEVLCAEGASVGDSAAGAVRECEAAITMLADDNAVVEVLLGGRGILSALPRGAVHVSCSTISTALARHLDAEHSAHGQHYMSAPVFGRPEAAEAKKLLVVAAGAPEQVSRCEPVFDAVGRQSFVAGCEPWLANAVKLWGNFMFACRI